MCAFAVTGGASRQKIDLPAIIEETLNDLRAIESSSNKQSTKTRDYKRLAEKIKTKLHEDGRKGDVSKIALTTYKRYLTKIRNAIKAAGYTHHSLKDRKALAFKSAEGESVYTVSRVQKDFPEYADLLESLRTEPAETIGALQHTILELINNDKKNKKKRKSDAYNAVKRIKLNHELIAHLVMNAHDRDNEKQQEEEALELKKGNTVHLAYADIAEIIRVGLLSPAYSHQAVALALASGRRAIEVLHNAEFVATGEHTVMFTGQAKKRTGIDAEVYEIYTLIPASEFVAAFEAFRQNKHIVDLLSDCNGLNKEDKSTLINKRTAKTLNGAAKILFANAKSMFKDTRAIYARVCLDKFWDKKTDEDLFVTKIMGHDSGKAQLHYKNFIIDYSAPVVAYKEALTNNADKDIEEPEKTIELASDSAIIKAENELADVTNAIEQFVKSHPTRRGLMNYHQKVMAWAALNPTLKINKSALAHKIGGNRDTRNVYYSAAESLLNSYNSTR